LKCHIKTATTFIIFCSDSFFKLLVLDEKLSHDKHENVDIVDSNPSLVTHVVNNNSYKLIDF